MRVGGRPGVVDSLGAGSRQQRCWLDRQRPRLRLGTLPSPRSRGTEPPKTWKATLQAISRVLKGWQEDAEPGNGERRSWRWMLEASTDANGYDHTGEVASLWAFLRLSLDRGEPGEPDKGEDIDLDGFGLQIWPHGDRAG